jgi:preprotein translocase SecE subunit
LRAVTDRPPLKDTNMAGSVETMEDKASLGQGGGEGSFGGGPRPAGGSLLPGPYKPDQGKYTRLGTMLGLGALIVWGGFFVRERLLPLATEGSAWYPVITAGIPLLLVALMLGGAWWLVYSHRKSGDFMIATEGEMKKVNWSSRREVIGSTRVVILFTLLMAAVLFMADLLFQRFFLAIGVLKDVSGS